MKKAAYGYLSNRHFLRNKNQSALNSFIGKAEAIGSIRNQQGQVEAYNFDMSHQVSSVTPFNEKLKSNLELLGSEKRADKIADIYGLKSKIINLVIFYLN